MQIRFHKSMNFDMYFESLENPGNADGCLYHGGTRMRRPFAMTLVGYDDENFLGTL